MLSNLFFVSGLKMVCFCFVVSYVMKSVLLPKGRTQNSVMIRRTSERDGIGSMFA